MKKAVVNLNPDQKVAGSKSGAHRGSHDTGEPIIATLVGEHLVRSKRVRSI